MEDGPQPGRFGEQSPSKAFVSRTKDGQRETLLNLCRRKTSLVAICSMGERRLETRESKSPFKILASSGGGGGTPEGRFWITPGGKGRQFRGTGDAQALRWTTEVDTGDHLRKHRGAGVGMEITFLMW